MTSSAKGVPHGLLYLVHILVARNSRDADLVDLVLAKSMAIIVAVDTIFW
jgi:hypothetical protein